LNPRSIKIQHRRQDLSPTRSSPLGITKPSNAAPDPFDVTNLRLDQSFVESAGVKKLLTTVPVRKPRKQEFIRARSDPAYRDAFLKHEGLLLRSL
jgi:hypothetical protein